MTKNSETYELRLRDVPINVREKVKAYRRIIEIKTGTLPSFTTALVELVDYSYRELCVKRIEQE